MIITGRPAPPSVAIVTSVHFPGARLAPLLQRLDATAGVTQIVCVVDGAAEQEREVVRSWSAGRPHITVLEHQEATGIARARNEALGLVTADYVWFVDDDDDWSRDALTRLAPLVIDRPDAVMFRAEYRHDASRRGRIVDGVDLDDTVTGATALRMLCRGEVHGFLWSKLFRTNLLGADPFPTLTSQSDVVGVARALARADRVRLSAHVLYTYFRRPGSITRQRTVRLANLRAASELVQRAASDTLSRAELTYFRSWFYVEGAIRTTARQRVRRRDARPAIRHVQATARSALLTDLEGESLRLRAVVRLARRSPWTAIVAARASYLLLDGARTARTIVRR